MQSPDQHTINVGASLLAIAVCQSLHVLTDTPLSRAGSLPQGLCPARNLFKNDLHLY